MPSPTPHPISRRQLLFATGVTGAAAAAGLLRPARALATSGPQSYTASWSSVDQHPPAPQWFMDAKFGIYFHWGVFSVPAFSNEWYPRNMYNAGSAENQHHIATYGDPSVWPYHNFILGANNKAGQFTKFQPKLVSAGGNWDPNAWASLFKQAGAKFAGPVAEHHDGYSMWNSQVTSGTRSRPALALTCWASTPQAIRAQGLKFMCSLHTAYHFNGYFQYVPAQSTATLQKLYGQLGSAAENPLWYNKLIEVINGYQPDMIYHDFDLNLVQESLPAAVPGRLLQRGGLLEQGRTDHLQGRVRQPGRGLRLRARRPGLHRDPLLGDRRQHLSLHLVLRQSIGYFTTQQLLHSFIDRISKGGTMLLNIAPMADGTIPSQQQSILLGLRGLAWSLRGGDLLHPGLVRLRRGPDAYGRRCLHRRRGRNPAGYPVHPQPGQHGAVRHRAGLARQHDDHRRP